MNDEVSHVNEQDEPGPVAESPLTAATVEVSLSNEQRTFALCSYLIPVVTSTTFIVPLVIWLLKKGEDTYIEAHAKEALNFQITFMIFAFVAWLTAFVLIGVLLIPAVMIAYFVLSIVAGVKAYKGEGYKIPLCIRLIR